ncbi:unnamed protein product [Aphanomyces euteiches]|uniref:Trichohyalin-plectin-homology domain-containing protein n=1 Tax=Aphanomyces euteiches TaxID=100861 RepID=A0A6G0WWJ8_9STRA|nr:hypothetical protein Ae201684_010957 [Aphanomyces euteiches]KAH9058473.1 hypothetical protein Ae201684P_005816 [Aphanomyces euteiches]KAH9139807.1 hypothetical protein AeRB84_015913 [Aphanomyces euteiches]
MTGSSTQSMADSQVTRTSLRTLDKERIRQKALYLNMKEKLRMSVCVRIQKVCKKNPQVAQQLSHKVMEHFRENGMTTNLSDADLISLVKSLSLSNSAKDVPHEESNDPSAFIKVASGKPKIGSKEKAPNSRDRKKPASQGDNESAYLTEAQAQQMSVGFVLPPKISPKKHKQGDIWNDLVKYQGIVEVQEAQSKLSMKAKRRMEWSSELDAQVAEKERRRIENAAEDGKYFEESLKKMEKMDIQEAEKERFRMERVKEQNKIQEQQRQAKLKKKEAEAEAQRQADLRLAETIAQRKAEDEAKEIARKEAEKVKMAQVLKENAEQLLAKKQIKMADRELEVKLAEDYIKMEERKDFMRLKGLEEMSKKIQAKMKYFDDTSKAEMEMKIKEEELRILRYQSEYDKRSIELDEKKKRDAMERNHAQQEYLKAQIKLKKDKERQEKEEYNKQADMWRKEREAEERKERLLQQQLASKNQMQQNWLRKQMEAKEKQALEADHTSLEMQLNQSLLRKVHELKQELQANDTNPSNVAAKTRQRSRELHEREKNEARKAKDPRLKPATRKK